MNKKLSDDSLHITRSELQKIMESEKLQRQRNGCYEFVEISEILSDISGTDSHYIHKQLQKAFDEGNILFFREGGLPADPADYNMWPGYGEYTTPVEINKWLKTWGASYRFRDDSLTIGNSCIKKLPELREEAILNWLAENGYDQFALPFPTKLGPNKPGVKAKAKSDLAIPKNTLFSKYTFDKAWQKLLNDKKIIQKP